VSGPEAQLRDALTAALMADASVQAVLGQTPRIYQTRPASAAFPHVSWGRAELISRDADGVELVETRLHLEVWERDNDVLPVTAVLRSALRAMDIELPAPWTLVSMLPVYADHFATRNPRVRRGLIRLKAVMAAAA
jgi:hypothetical protein